MGETTDSLWHRLLCRSIQSAVLLLPSISLRKIAWEGTRRCPSLAIKTSTLYAFVNSVTCMSQWLLTKVVLTRSQKLHLLLQPWRDNANSAKTCMRCIPKEIYGEDAEVFKPERWFEEDLDRLEFMTKASDLLFSKGRWQCLGKNIAMMQLNKTIFEVLESVLERGLRGQPREPLACPGTHWSYCRRRFVGGGQGSMRTAGGAGCWVAKVLDFRVSKKLLEQKRQQHRQRICFFSPRENGILCWIFYPRQTNAPKANPLQRHSSHAPPTLPSPQQHESPSHP